MNSDNENNSFQPKFTINLRGELMDLSTPRIMGILNLTPDSFYDGGIHQKEEAYLFQVERMLNEGADFIDVGAVSTKPNAQSVSTEEELERLIAPLERIIQAFPEAYISVDTFRSQVAEAALDRGAVMINDVSAGRFDNDLFPLIAERNCPYILMHMQGEPKNMQIKPTYEDVVKEVFYFFTEKINELRLLGVNDLILDLGFGFGKSLAHNFQLLSELNHFKHLNLPILAGLSRKSMIQKALNTSAYNSINGTTAAHVIALMKGANLLRVHDVLEAKQAIDIVGMCQKH